MFGSSWLLVFPFVIYGVLSGQATRKFPADFKFGAGSAAYQIEGGWDADGKGPSLWDYITHLRPKSFNGSNGDVACDSYHKYKTDVKMLKELGVDFYKFSISWPRILPKGTAVYVNEAGVKYYNDLIDELVKENIEPFVVMFHGDVPQELQEDGGGFVNPDVIKAFESYAELLFSLYGDRVKNWITINEPEKFCTAITAAVSRINQRPPGIDEYLCGHNLLLAHSNVYHLYDRHYRAQQKGKISISVSSEYSIPASHSSKDIEAAERDMQFLLGWFAHPVLIGDYPKIMKKRILQRSMEQGFHESRLPSFSLLEMLKMRGTIDFLCINHYTSHLVTDSSENKDDKVSRDDDVGVISSHDPSWKSTQLDRMKVFPRGLRSTLNWVKKNYGNIEIIITESGCPGDDISRIEYFQLYLNALLDARYEDEVNVTGYTVWSLMDSFEWVSGYQAKFGLYAVDFEDENRTRTPKPSAQFYKNLIAKRAIQFGKRLPWRCQYYLGGLQEEKVVRTNDSNFRCIIK